MKALRYHGARDVRVETVPDPQLADGKDMIVKVTACAICGSDLHLYDGLIPTLQKGDILGHEFMGEVLEVGREVRDVQKGDRVVVPFNISCGDCFFCKRQLWSLCDRSNPNAALATKQFGAAPAGLFGYSHMFGGYPGGQAEYVRVPFADVNHVKIETDLSDEQVLFIGDIFSTGFMAVDVCDVQEGDVVAVWGCGPVGLFALKSALMLGAKRVIAIDRFPERLELARTKCDATPIDYEKSDVIEVLKELTSGRGPDICIDAVGMEAHGHGLEFWYDRVKQAVGLQTDRPTALRQAVMACRKGGTVSVPGVYGGPIDHFPFGAAFNKGLTLKMGQTHTHRYAPALLQRIAAGEIDPSFIITHRLHLEEAPKGYDIFQHKKEGCIKVVLKP
ncbi:glutathione-dependent formaldehyde dehydrogenase [Nannocystis sp. ILAH1]|uniref:zinc-dependent alcohol dehydrogenase n=1 Tax=Nannocystis sp. ILAH1 TaxID=2996789 RepID=UPI002270EF51|nr:zinc-dependent alcohol dehydrogenase [Nannocystis sp. ILAH1]MCY0990473.1 glutathione-dependent formaldehyde dehydrogenase [Nannocystis sp. ILAH1]